MAVPPAPVRVPSQSPLAPSVTSVTSVANDKGDNEMIPGAVHRSLGICITAEENSGKSQLGHRLMNGLSSSQMGSLSYCMENVVTLVSVLWRMCNVKSFEI